MATRRYSIVDGPDKPALQMALANPGEQNVHFRVEGDVFDAQIMRMDGGEQRRMARCDVWGNECDKALTALQGLREVTFDRQLR